MYSLSPTFWPQRKAVYVNKLGGRDEEGLCTHHSAGTRAGMSCNSGTFNLTAVIEHCHASFGVKKPAKRGLGHELKREWFFGGAQRGKRHLTFDGQLLEIEEEEKTRHELFHFNLSILVGYRCVIKCCGRDTRHVSIEPQHGLHADI